MDIQRAEILLVDEARARMARLIVPAPIGNKAENLRELTRLFEGVGICKLITAGDVEKCRENWIRGAQARRYFLRKSHDEGNLADRFLALSRVQAVMDAVAAGDDTLARDIVALSIHEWNPDWEYEDDFCYYLFFHGLVVNPQFAQTPEAEALLGRFARALEGKPSVPLELCQAAAAREPEPFRAAFEGLVARYEKENEEKRVKFTEYTSGAVFWPASFVSIEALAWLRLAASLGVEPADEFAFCPAEARRITSGAAVPDLFESLERALQQS
jgi:hypothetical protein